MELNSRCYSWSFWAPRSRAGTWLILLSLCAPASGSMVMQFKARVDIKDPRSEGISARREDGRRKDEVRMTKNQKHKNSNRVECHEFLIF